MGHCRYCGGRLVYQNQACRNKLCVVTCHQCGAIYDRSYSPSTVFVSVQSQRRDCPPSQIKQLLRQSQTSPPQFVRERYWIVYRLPNELTVFYDSEYQRYDVRLPTQKTVTVGGTRDLINWIAKNTTIQDNDSDHVT